MKKLIIVADDFGFTDGINRACVKAYKEGILKEMSLMLDSPATVKGVKLANENDIENLGIHITLNDIVGTGKYLRTSDYKLLLQNESSKKISARVLDELKKFEDLVGRLPTHINGHHHCHLHPKNINTILDYALENNIYIRRSRSKVKYDDSETEANKILVNSGAKIANSVIGHIEGTLQDVFNNFIRDLNLIEDNSLTEIFFHPAFVDETLKKYSSMLHDRERDFEVLIDKSFEKKIRELGFDNISFSDL